MALRVAAIDFLNPAPLMWDFLHPPRHRLLASRYSLHPMLPAACARAVLSGEADLGLIPIAALTPALRVVPGCTIASQRCVRSIQLIVKAPLSLAQVRTVAADTASRSSVAYAQVLFRHFLGADPAFLAAAADLPAMLAIADAALIIGDPALLALEQRDAIEAAAGPCAWHDVAELWHTHTGLPWVAAVWAARPEAIPDAAQLTGDLVTSRDHGLAGLPQLVEEWRYRITLPPATIAHYLSENIHYHLGAREIEAMLLFRYLAAVADVLPPLPEIPWLIP